ncbi:MAG: hypothetical protein Q4G40_13055, partial [Brachybacterium sp.]|nr:hypothetical protein [Brachybacterium sp.]
PALNGSASQASTSTGDESQAQSDLALFDEVITPDDIETLRAIINAAPPGTVNLVVPWDAVLGAVCSTCRAPMVQDGATADEQCACRRAPGRTVRLSVTVVMRAHSTTDSPASAS